VERPACLIALRSLFPLPDIDEVPGNRGSRRHGGRNEMGAALEALAALEVAVRGRRATLLGLELVRVHGEAHRAARLAPVESGLDEDLVEALGFRLLLHDPRARDDHRVDVGVNRLALGDFRRRAQILDPAVVLGWMGT
jgi:hypothetical protein